MERIRMVICLIILLWNTPVFCSAQGSTQLKVGAERIEVVTRLLKDKRVGLVVNQTSCLGEQQQHLLDVLLERGIDVRCVFAPEHGFRGKILKQVFLSFQFTESIKVRQLRS